MVENSFMRLPSEKERCEFVKIMFQLGIDMEKPGHIPFPAKRELPTNITYRREVELTRCAWVVVALLLFNCDVQTKLSQ